MQQSLRLKSQSAWIYYSVDYGHQDETRTIILHDGSGCDSYRQRYRTAADRNN
jgi:hypothetical protein